jgi:hypothetical protein
MADEKPTKRTPRRRLNDTTALTPPAAAQEPNKAERCPFGHRFGRDCDETPDCEDCEIWMQCNAVMVDGATAARERRAVTVTPPPAVQPAGDEDEDDKPEAPPRWGASVRQRMAERRKPEPAAGPPEPTRAAAPVPWGGDPFNTAPENESGSNDFGDGYYKAKLDQESGEFLKSGLDLEEETPVSQETVWEVDGNHFAQSVFKDGERVARYPYGGGTPKLPRDDPRFPPKPERGLDPVLDSGFLHLTDPQSGERLTVYGGSVSMRGEIARLAREIKTRQGAHAELRPLIRLRSKQRRSQKYQTEYWVPIFQVVDWMLPDGTRLSQPRDR